MAAIQVYDLDFYGPIIFKEALNNFVFKILTKLWGENVFFPPHSFQAEHYSNKTSLN